MQDLALRNQYGISVVAIQKQRQTIEEIDPSYRFEADDIVIVIGSNENIHNFERIVANED